MFRVISSYRNGGPRPVVEKGPWHPDRASAEAWADILRMLGYVTTLESQFGGAGQASNEELASALASMA